jgi:hypothetical protein
MFKALSYDSVARYSQGQVKESLIYLIFFGMYGGGKLSFYDVPNGTVH